MEEMFFCPSCMAKAAPVDGKCPVCGHDVNIENAPHQLPVNTILNGRYIIGRVLGAGGFGITYIGYDLKLDGKVAVKAFEKLEENSGLDNLADLARGREDYHITYKATQVQPQEIITTPAFTGSNTNRRYTPFTLSIEEKLPFRTVTGRQSFYLDHELVQEYGEALATYKPILDYTPLKLAHDGSGRKEIALKYLTPHNKWSTHSMYFDSQQLLTLFRGGQSVFLNEQDAAAIGAKDNDWLEVYNRNGVVAARVVTTARIPRGSMYMHHAQDRHINVPGTSLVGTRGSGHNGPTHIHVKPTHMIGGYGQLRYGFNYYGTTGNQRDILVVVRKMEEVDWLEG